MVEGACRIDVWLWRARLCKTRSLAGAVADAGRIRLTRGGEAGRADKASRAIKIGDELIFAHAGHLIAVRVEALGLRRGPASEARALYTVLEDR